VITRRRLLLAAVALPSFATAASACSETSAEGARETSGSVDLSRVTLRVGDQKAGSRPLLSAAGELDDVKYDIEWKLFTSGPPLLEAVNAGELDMGGVGNTPPIFAAAAGADIKAVGSTETTMDGQAIVVPQDTDIRSPKDLSGKRIAATRGSSAHYHLMSVLTKNGLSLDDVEMSNLEPADALAAFSQGDVDAWAIWDPYTAQAQAQENARILVDGKGYVNGYGFQVASGSSLDDPSIAAATRDYLTRLYRAQLWSNDHREKWARVWSEETGIPYQMTLVAAKRRLITPQPINDEVVESEQRMADDFAEAGEIPEEVDFGDFVDTRFNNLVAQAKKS
jgi:sulfonate transport system substrate-binding protein